LVFARGHAIDQVAEVPLVVEDAAESVQKTKQAIAILKALGAYADVEKVKESRKLRCGVGKMRNRRHVQRRGPLVVYSEDKGITQAFRNLPGVELASVDRLNLLQLAPGGHLGRFIIWTRGAFAKLEQLWGSLRRESTDKKGYTLPRNLMVQTDLTRLINSEEIQSKVRPAIKTQKRRRQHKNPLTNLGTLVRLNPYALALRRSALVAEERRLRAKSAATEARRKNLKAPHTVDHVASIKANKVHHKNQTKNYLRLSGPIIVAKKAEEKKEEKPAAAAAPTKAAAPAPAAAKLAAAAPAKAEAKKPEAKKDDKKPAEGKKDDKKPAEGKKDDKPAKGGDKGGDKAAKGGDKPAKAEKAPKGEKPAKAEKAPKGEKPAK